MRACLRRATTLLELIVVGILMMTLMSTITAFVTMMPHWFTVLTSRANVGREETVARSFLERDLNLAVSCACDGDNLRVTLADATVVTYLRAEIADSPGHFDLRRSLDGGATSMRVASNVRSFQCIDQPTWGGLDVCMVLEHDGKYRRAVFHARSQAKVITRDIALGDVNRDGIADLVMVYTDESQVTVSLGNTGGGFGSQTPYTLLIGAETKVEPLAVQLTDLNRDGILDVVVATRTDLRSLLGTAAGTFPAPVAFAAGTAPRWVKIGDFNRDGKADAAVGEEAIGAVRILLGNGSGGFAAPATRTVAQAVTALAIADPNRDGVEDLIVGHANAATTISIALGTGTGAFGAPTTYAAGSACNGLAVADLTRDGIPDVVSVDEGEGQLRIIPVTSTGTLNTGGIEAFATPYPVAVAALAWNSDAIPDVVVLNRLRSGAASTVTRFRGAATTPHLIADGAATNTGVDGTALVAGDILRDARDDWVAGWMTGPPPGGGHAEGLAPTSNTSGTLVVASHLLLPTALADARKLMRGIAAGDFDRDGLPDVAAVTAFGQGAVKRGVQTSWGLAAGGFTNPPTFSDYNPKVPLRLQTADLNRDGKLDLLIAMPAETKIFCPLGTAVQLAAWANNPPQADTGVKPDAIATADYDRDGLLDFFAASVADLKYGVGKGDGLGGAVSKRQWSPGSACTGIALGDLDRNGYPDILACTRGTASNQLRVVLHDGTTANPPYPTAESGVYAMSAANGAESVAVGDFNRDGKLDVVTANDGALDSLVIRNGNGAGGFAAVGAGQTLAGITSPRQVRVADMNMDGKLDLVACGDGSDLVPGRVWIWIGNGDGTFPTAAPSSTYTVGNNPFDVWVLDYDRDGKPDVVVSHDSTDAGIAGRVWAIPGK